MPKFSIPKSSSVFTALKSIPFSVTGYALKTVLSNSESEFSAVRIKSQNDSPLPWCTADNFSEGESESKNAFFETTLPNGF